MDNAYCDDSCYCAPRNRIAELAQEIEQYKQVIYNAQNAMDSAEEELQILLYQENLNAAENSPYTD